MRKNYEKPVAELVGFDMNRSIATTVDCGEIPDWMDPFGEECGDTVYCVETTHADFVS